ncbi:MAG: hypothetical protein WBY94_19455 [Polyangiaceae bacterium]
MRPWTLLFLVLATACASAEAPTGALDAPAAVGAGDDASFAGTIGTYEAPPEEDDGAASTPLEVPSAAPTAVDPTPTDPSAAADAYASEQEEDAAAEAASDQADTALPPFDAGEGGVCTAALAPGDLVIDELMIESVAGTGDHGEWLEVQSTLDCALDLRGLHGEAPDGNKIRIFDVGDDLWIPALGTFLVADSNNAAINHDLPGALIVWSGQPGDVLRNKGGTVTLDFGGTIIDSVTYPSMTLTVGASLAFPSDCMPSQRSDWSSWQPSASAWFPGFSGTPNAPNDDVQCP